MGKVKKAKKNRKGGPSTKCSPSDYPVWHKALRRAFLDRPIFFAGIIAANAADIICEELGTIFSSIPGLLPPVAPAGYMEWALASLGQHSPPLLQTALAIRKQAASRGRQERREVAANVFILKEPVRLAILNGMFHHSVRRLPPGKEYPPRRHWVASTPGLFETWDPWFRNCQQPNKRIPRRPVMLLDPDRIQLEIPAGLSCIIRDEDTKEIVFVAFRNFSGHQGILNWAHDLVCRVAAHRRCIRLEDPGHLAQVGFSSGSRSAPAFGMVRNFICHEGSEVENAENRELAAVMSYLWVRAKRLYPAEIIEDFENFYSHYNIPRFDPGWPASYSGQGALQFPLATGTYSFQDVERAPGCGVVAQRYARAVHYENQPHKWAIAWTNYRRGSELVGGDFYLCEYGIWMRAQEDDCFSWPPHLWHATGLANYEPTFELPELPDPIHTQQGIIFVTSSRLAGVYTKWEAEHGVPGKQKVVEALKEFDAGPKVDDDIYD